MKILVKQLVFPLLSISVVFMLATGVIIQIPLITYLGLCLITLNIILSIMYGEQISRPLLIFILVMLPFTLALSYESISYYPLGADVHSEYYVLKSLLNRDHIELLKEANVPESLSPPPYYYEIYSYIFFSSIFKYITMVDEVVIIKYIWNTSILGLIPLITYLYIRKVTGNTASTLIGSYLIISQSTYIVTLHSTSKNVAGLFMLGLLLYLLTSYLGDPGSRRPTGVILILILISFNGFHYMSSGIGALISSLAIIPLLLTYKWYGSEVPSSQKFVMTLTLLWMISWFLTYALLTNSIIKPLINLVTNLLYLTPLPHGYELINVSSLPTYLNYLRLLVDALISLLILMAGLDSSINLLRNRGGFIDSLIAVAACLFYISSAAEIFKLTTIGVGRLSIIYILIISPYLYKSIVTIFLRKIPFRRYMKNTIILLTLAIIISTRIMLSTGAVSYAMGSVESSIFLDPLYRYKTSVTYADIKSAVLLNEYYSDVKPVVLDLKSIDVFHYVENLRYFTVKLLPLSENRSELGSDIVYFNSYNLLVGKIHVRVNVFIDYNEYHYLNEVKSLVFNYGYSIILY